MAADANHKYRSSDGTTDFTFTFEETADGSTQPVRQGLLNPNAWRVLSRHDVLLTLTCPSRADRVVVQRFFRPEKGADL